MIEFWNKLPPVLQQVFLLGFIMAVLVAANMIQANDPSGDDVQRGIVQAIILRALALVGIKIEAKQ